MWSGTRKKSSKREWSRFQGKGKQSSVMFITLIVTLSILATFSLKLPSLEEKDGMKATVAGFAYEVIEDGIFGEWGTPGNDSQRLSTPISIDFNDQTIVVQNDHFLTVLDKSNPHEAPKTIKTITLPNQSVRSLSGLNAMTLGNDDTIFIHDRNLGTIQGISARNGSTLKARVSLPKDDNNNVIVGLTVLEDHLFILSWQSHELNGTSILGRLFTVNANLSGNLTEVDLKSLELFPSEPSSATPTYIRLQAMTRTSLGLTIIFMTSTLVKNGEFKEEWHVQTYKITCENTPSNRSMLGNEETTTKNLTIIGTDAHSFHAQLVLDSLLPSRESIQQSTGLPFIRWGNVFFFDLLDEDTLLVSDPFFGNVYLLSLKNQQVWGFIKQVTRDKILAEPMGIRFDAATRILYLVDAANHALLFINITDVTPQQFLLLNDRTNSRDDRLSLPLVPLLVAAMLMMIRKKKRQSWSKSHVI